METSVILTVLTLVSHSTNYDLLNKQESRMAKKILRQKSYNEVLPYKC